MSSSNIYSHTCEKCETNFTRSSTWGSTRFCTKACANSRARPQELRDRVGNTLKSRYASNELQRKTPPNKGQSKLPKIECPICGSLCKPKRKTCSRPCRVILSSQNALKQEKHGGGHKGRYKGTPCDSTYELAFLIWHLDHGIDIKRCESVYPYTYKDKMSSYKPDFVVEGQEIEIKGYMCNRAQAKLDQNPHVFVVDKVAIQPYLNYVKEVYQIKHVKDLYDK